MHRNPRRTVHEGRPLSRMQTSIIRAVSLIFLAIGRYWSLPGFWTDALKEASSLQLDGLLLNEGVLETLARRNFVRSAWYFRFCRILLNLLLGIKGLGRSLELMTCIPD